MADSGGSPAGREALLRSEYLSQTARIRWHELQPWYAKGSVIRVQAGLDLVEVAVQLGLDNARQFEQWIGEGRIAAVSDGDALAWYEVNRELWAVVAPPWVLVQQAD
jgi:hypothetical protein